MVQPLAPNHEPVSALDYAASVWKAIHFKLALHALGTVHQSPLPLPAPHRHSFGPPWNTSSTPWTGVPVVWPSDCKFVGVLEESKQNLPQPKFRDTDAVLRQSQSAMLNFSDLGKSQSTCLPPPIWGSSPPPPLHVSPFVLSPPLRPPPHGWPLPPVALFAYMAVMYIVQDRPRGFPATLFLAVCLCWLVPRGAPSTCQSPNCVPVQWGRLAFGVRPEFLTTLKTKKLAC